MILFRILSGLLELAAWVTVVAGLAAASRGDRADVALAAKWALIFAGAAFLTKVPSAAADSK